MRFNFLPVILLIFGICSPLANAADDKIPVTSSSAVAVDHYEKATSLSDRDEIDRAESELKKALALDPDFALAHLALGMLRDNYDERRNRIAMAMKQIDKVSEGERLWIKARNAFYGTGEDQEEYPAFEALVKLHPNDEKANYFFGFVNFRHGRVDYDTATKHFKRAIEINPNYIAPHNEIAYAFMESGKFNQAEVFIKKYISLLPTSPNAYDTYADMLMRSGRHSESIRMYDKVLSMKKDSPWALMGKAANLNFLGRHAQGRAALAKLDSIKLSDYEERHKWIAKTVSFVDQGKYSEAAAVLQEQFRVAETKNDFHQLYFSKLRLIRLLFFIGQGDDGLAEYHLWNEVVQAKSTDPSVKKRAADHRLYFQAYASFLKGDRDSARSFLAEYETANGRPNDDSRFLGSLLLIANKDYDKAIEALKATNQTDVLNQYYLARAHALNKDRAATKPLIAKILAMKERNNLNLALVRRHARNL